MNTPHEATLSKNAKPVEVNRVNGGTTKVFVQKDYRRPNSVFCSAPPVFSMTKQQAETFINEMADLLESMEK